MRGHKNVQFTVLYRLVKFQLRTMQFDPISPQLELIPPKTDKNVQFCSKMMIFALQVQHFFPFSKPRRKGRFHWRRGQRPGEGTRQYMVLGTVASGLVASCTRKTNGARPCGRRKASFFPVTVTKKKFDRRLKKSCTFSNKIEHFSKFCQNGIWARDHRHF